MTYNNHKHIGWQHHDSNAALLLCWYGFKPYGIKCARIVWHPFIYVVSQLAVHTSMYLVMRKMSLLAQVLSPKQQCHDIIICPTAVHSPGVIHEVAVTLTCVRGGIGSMRSTQQGPQKVANGGYPSETVWVQAGQVYPSESKKHQWAQVNSHSSKRFQANPIDPKWAQVTSNEYKWVKVTQSSPVESKRSQTSSSWHKESK